MLDFMMYITFPSVCSFVFLSACKPLTFLTSSISTKLETKLTFEELCLIYHTFSQSTEVLKAGIYCLIVWFSDVVLPVRVFHSYMESPFLDACTYMYSLCYQMSIYGMNTSISARTYFLLSPLQSAAVYIASAHSIWW